MLYIPDDDKLADDENEMNEFDENDTGPVSADNADALKNAAEAKIYYEDIEGFIIEDCSIKKDDITDVITSDVAGEAYADCIGYDKMNDEENISGDLGEIEKDGDCYVIKDVEPTDLAENESCLQEEELTYKQKRKKSLVKGLIYDLIFYAFLTFACIYIIPNFVLQRTIVDGSSMEDTLRDREQLYVEKISYHFNALKRFDIIVFYPYGREHDDYYVKRIIGLPGEKVQIIDGKIYINDELLEENYGKEPIKDPGRAANPIYLGEDEYFVMGDNRNRSKDSRSEQVGNVKKENIGGRVILRIYPFDRFGFVD